VILAQASEAQAVPPLARQLARDVPAEPTSPAARTVPESNVDAADIDGGSGGHAGCELGFGRVGSGALPAVAGGEPSAGPSGQLRDGRQHGAVPLHLPLRRRSCRREDFRGRRAHRAGRRLLQHSRRGQLDSSVRAVLLGVRGLMRKRLSGQLSRDDLHEHRRLARGHR